ncbi:MAG: hypothetical protein IKJ63_00430 [Clostridia bacterium]|nr:hypothetical protein [Clostridia bacterium]
MKKMISVLLCLVLLLSFSAFAAAIGRSSLQLKSYRESLSDGAYACFNLSAKNCTDLESFELVIRYNPDVLQYSENYPFTSIAVVRNTTKCTVADPGKLSVIGINNGYGMLKKEFNPFCFKVIGTGNTDISVELVSFRTADGEVENVALDANIQNFTVTDFFVKYDLTGDSVVTAGDARLALRFAVGLDSATDAQCRAAAVSTTNEFTADIARTILRCSVGLEP